jgi:hypothetical protein
MDASMGEVDAIAGEDYAGDVRIVLIRGTDASVAGEEEGYG